MASMTLLESFDVKGLLLFFVAFLLVLDYLKSKSPPNYPPGPFALPFLGNIFSMVSKQPHIYLTKIGDAYNNIFSLRIWREKVVFLTGYKMVKEALVNQAEIFVDRPFSQVFERVYGGNGGLFSGNGETWRTQRRFALTTLRNFGLGKKTMELAICEEYSFLQEEIDRQKGEAFDPAALFNNAVANIICQLVFGQRFDYADRDFQQMLGYISEAVLIEGSMWGQLYETYPNIMKHLPGKHNALFNDYNFVLEFARKHMVKHKAELDPSNPRDYMDSFLIEKENSHEPEEGFSEKNLAMCTLDLFSAGSETTASALRWGLLYLVKYPEIQVKLQEEIDRVIGQSRQPNMGDKPNMPYTEAVIHEILRKGEIVPLNGARMAVKDTTLGGYSIPKGTTVMPILHSVLMDENEWEKPSIFNPDRFLDKDGNFVRRDAFLPFSAGKRVCLGEQLARMELFLFLISIFQKFSYSAVEGVPLNLEGVFGITRSPHPFKIYAKVR